MLIRRALVSVATVVLPATLAPTAIAASPTDSTVEPVYASFEGRTINLAEGWQGAQACNTDGTTTVCYRNATDAEAGGARVAAAAPEASCATPLRLYDGTSYSGAVLNLYTTGTWINLNGYGFDAKTSSYQVGACSITMKDGLGGSGAIHPGTSAANTSAPAMAAGWNNRVRSVRIN